MTDARSAGARSVGGQASTVVENGRTGEQIEFVAESAEVLVMHATWTRPGHRSVRHTHPGMEERWTVLEGRASFEIDGVTVEASEGSVVVAPPGKPHIAWNPTEAVVRLRIEMRPALRWAEFTKRLFAGEDPEGLLREFGAEVKLAPLAT